MIKGRLKEQFIGIVDQLNAIPSTERHEFLEFLKSFVAINEEQTCDPLSAFTSARHQEDQSNSSFSQSGQNSNEFTSSTGSRGKGDLLYSDSLDLDQLFPLQHLCDNTVKAENVICNKSSVEIVHSSTSKPVTTKPLDSVELHCPLCRRRFSKWPIFENHLYTGHVTSVPPVCWRCQGVFLNQAVLLAHECFEWGSTFLPCSSLFKFPTKQRRLAENSFDQIGFPTDGVFLKRRCGLCFQSPVVYDSHKEFESHKVTHHCNANTSSSGLTCRSRRKPTNKSHRPKDTHPHSVEAICTVMQNLVKRFGQLRHRQIFNDMPKKQDVYNSGSIVNFNTVSEDSTTITNLNKSTSPSAFLTALLVAQRSKRKSKSMKLSESEPVPELQPSIFPTPTFDDSQSDSEMWTLSDRRFTNLRSSFRIGSDRKLRWSRKRPNLNITQKRKSLTKKRQPHQRIQQSINYSNEYKTGHARKHFICNMCSATFRLSSRLRAHYLFQHGHIPKSLGGLSPRADEDSSDKSRSKLSTIEEDCDSTLNTSKQHFTDTNIRIFKNKRNRIGTVGKNASGISSSGSVVPTSTATSQLCVCSICKRSFKNVYNLNRHFSTTHESMYKFCCGYCNFRTNERFSFDVHLARHFGIKPFSCETCGARFAVKVELTDHIAFKHSTERKYVCPVCSITFKTSGTLWRHRKIHEPRKVHSCPICSITFTRLSNLNRHVNKFHDAIHTPFMNGTNNSELIDPVPLSNHNNRSSLKKTARKRHNQKLSATKKDTTEFTDLTNINSDSFTGPCVDVVTIPEEANDGIVDNTEQPANGPVNLDEVLDQATLPVRIHGGGRGSPHNQDVEGNPIHSDVAQGNETPVWPHAQSLSCSLNDPDHTLYMLHLSDLDTPHGFFRPICCAPLDTGFLHAGEDRPIKNANSANTISLIPTTTTSLSVANSPYEAQNITSFVPIQLTNPLIQTNMLRSDTGLVESSGSWHLLTSESSEPSLCYLITATELLEPDTTNLKDTVVASSDQSALTFGPELTRGTEIKPCLSISTAKNESHSNNLPTPPSNFIATDTAENLHSFYFESCLVQNNNGCINSKQSIWRPMDPLDTENNNSTSAIINANNNVSCATSDSPIHSSDCMDNVPSDGLFSSNSKALVSVQDWAVCRHRQQVTNVDIPYSSSPCFPSPSEEDSIQKTSLIHLVHPTATFHTTSYWPAIDKPGGEFAPLLSNTSEPTFSQSYYNPVNSFQLLSAQSQNSNCLSDRTTCEEQEDGDEDVQQHQQPGCSDHGYSFSVGYLIGPSTASESSIPSNFENDDMTNGAEPGALSSSEADSSLHSQSSEF